VAVPGAYAYLLERIDALVKEIGVAYIKWDHNRDLHEAGVHAQTQAVYRLLDEVRERNPGLEIESCASGGARVDLGILERTDRVWASDTNDALERQQIQRWTSLLLPPELVGSHVGGPVSHTTGRTADLGMRCLTALFAHAGIEWDITRCTEEEITQLAGWARLYRELRPLLHSGDVVRADSNDALQPFDPDTLLHGVVAPDRGEAVFGYTRLRTSTAVNPGRLRLPGLDPQRLYRVRRRDEAGTGRGQAIGQPPWWARGETLASGAVLASVGLPAPLLNPAQAVLLHLRAD
jgi:alpha-galactosidase